VTLAARLEQVADPGQFLLGPAAHRLTLGRIDVDAVFVLKEALLRRAAADVGGAALAQKLPILVGDQDLVTAPGVVAAAGPDQRELGKRCGRMMARPISNSGGWITNKASSRRPSVCSSVPL